MGLRYDDLIPEEREDVQKVRAPSHMTSSSAVEISVDAVIASIRHYHV